MHFTYLAIDFFTILFPFLWSFESRIHFSRKWKYFIPANLVTAFFFLVWDYFKTKHGVWGFNSAYILGIKFWGLPLEEVLFFVTVPYSCTFIYEVVGFYFKHREGSFPFRYLFLTLSFIALILSYFALGKAYTFWVLFIGAVVIPPLSFLMNTIKLQKFLITYFISLLPMLIVNGLLTALPVVIYNDLENIGVRIGSIPVEDFFYCFILLLMNISLYEYFQKYSAKQIQ
jgi:lycopene cyclase domain-containing protein